MKRAVILLLLAALLLTGCAAETSEPQGPYGHFVGNTFFLVDPAAMTITANGQVFTFEYLEDGVSITYPNGAICKESDGTIAWSNADADFIINNGADYVDCHMLLVAIPERVQKEEWFTMWPLIIGGIGIVALGVWMYTCPQVLWRWRYGWRYKNGEPSDTGLAVIMASGILNIILGVVLILIGIFA